MTTMILLLYGLNIWGAVCNAPTWGRLLWQRLREVRQRGLFAAWRDASAAIRMGVFVGALGTILLAGDRLRAQLDGHQPLTVPSAAGVVGTVLLVIKEIDFLRATALTAGARGRRSWAWPTYWIGAAIWCALVVIGVAR